MKMSGKVLKNFRTSILKVHVSISTFPVTVGTTMSYGRPCCKLWNYGEKNVLLNAYSVCIIKFLLQETPKQKNKCLMHLIQLSLNSFTVMMQTSAPQLALVW
jgi:hypothetical protein